MSISVYSSVNCGGVSQASAEGLGYRTTRSIDECIDIINELSLDEALQFCEDCNLMHLYYELIGDTNPRAPKRNWDDHPHHPR